MKTKLFWSHKAVLLLGVIPLVAASYPVAHPDDQEATPADGTQQSAAVQPTATPTNLPSAPTTPANLKLYGGTAEVVKMAQSGVSEDVMMTYITNSKVVFGLGADQIIYLNDLGVSGTVVTAMIKHDAAQTAALAQPPPTAAIPTPEQMAAAQPVLPPDYTDNGNVPDYTDNTPYPAGDYSVPNDSDYFYDALAPYGAWNYLPGYGYCWQPTVYIRDRQWRPYNDRGRWLYSDCGWYWQSDYSWGWAAFHYGRWFLDGQRGWLWMPNRVWGPSWVSWRQSPEYVGWAPLPPSAVFTPGIGLAFHHQAVGVGFEFGVGPGLYTFIPTERIVDYAPVRYGVSRVDSATLFNQTQVVNRFGYLNRKVISLGVDARQVEALTGQPLRRAQIRDAENTTHAVMADRLEKHGNSLVLTRPPLPAPSNHANSPALAPGGNNNARRLNTTSVTSPVTSQPLAATTSSLASPAVALPAQLPQSASRVAATPVPVKPRVQVYVRPPDPAPAATRNSQYQPYPPNSLVLQGQRNLTNPQANETDQTQPAPALWGRNSTATYTTPPAAQNGNDATSRTYRGFGYQPVYNSATPAAGAPSQAQPASQPQPTQWAVPPRANYGTMGYQQPANVYSAPARQPPYEAPAYRPAPSYSAPAPAPSRSYSAPPPAPAASSSSSQSSSSSSTHR